MKAEDVQLEFYSQGMSSVARSGVFEFLKLLGRVRGVPKDGYNYEGQHIAEANRSIGYMQCLDDLFYFKERFLNVSPVAAPMMDYGAIDTLLERKAIDEKEADELRKQFGRGAIK